MGELIAMDGTRPCDYKIGLDVGSTTTKALVVDAASGRTVYSTYRRHFAHQAQSLSTVLNEIAEKLGDASVRIAMSGSGGKALADYLDMPYMQEVVANSLAVRKLHPQARCAIELGGQDAKMIFFQTDPETGVLTVSDMRMNGSCAGGTGAFIDEIAALLKIPVEDLDSFAARGTTSYDISGRCGVYAKTDIQPLLNAGARKEDLALSTFHAIAKQTLGGLAQGLDIKPPVIFEGGPLTFNKTLVSVFAQELALSDDEIIIPEHPETIVAAGAVLSLDGMHAKSARTVKLSDVIEKLEHAGDALKVAEEAQAPFFADKAAEQKFRAAHRTEPRACAATTLPEGSTPRVYLGIDSGSTTTKFALIDEEGELVDEFYSSNEGEPLDIAVAAMKELKRRYDERGIELKVLGCATTGYGENLFAHAFHADTHLVETVAHTTAAMRYVPDASFVLDIGGQDMKAIWLSDGIVTNIVVNEACSSGCGSFLEGFAKSLNIAVEDIADAAFSSTDPAKLGSRCTVFMNSSVVTEQKNGKTPADIMAGLCRSIIENVFTKVIRVSNLDSLGNNIVVQGGTFENDAVLAAFEDYVGRPVTRAPHPGLMGAIGAALSARQHAQKMRAARGLFSSSFIGFDALDDFSFEQQSNLVCPLCGNHCARTLVRFSDGSEFVTGNRCERGTVIGDVRDEETRARLKEIAADQKKVPNLFATRERLLFADYPVKPLCPDRGIVVGLPRVLALWEFAPFWTTLLRALGFSLRLSHLSTRKMYENGLSAVTSDTVCFPAKLVHGHIRDLVEQGVDRIFMPEVTTIKSENTEKTSESMCAVVKGYPMVIRNSDSPERRFGVPFDDPLFHWHTDEDKKRQLSSWLDEKWGIDEDTVLAALAQADAAQAQFKNELAAEGERVLDQVRAQGGYAIVLASRPYHNDPLVNHDLPEMLTSLGIPVLTPDAVPGVNEVDLSMSLIDIVNNFHARMLGSAVVAANDPALEYVQVVSFGCGHDAYLSDEIVRLMREISGKSPLVLKVDESDATGPLRIRVRSFVETIERKRSRLRAVGEMPEPRKLEDPYPAKFSKADRKKRTLLVPNTSHAFSRVMAAIFSKEGIDAVPLPVGRERAIELGKKYVHNDICFPAQIVIGEALAELETGKYDDDEVAIGMAKYIGDCRLTHYAALLRKALDDSGHATVPIVTNDDVDYHNMHPGYTFSLSAAIRTAMVLPMIDALEELLRKIRPYELEKGSADAAFEHAMDILVDGLSKHGARGAQRAFAKSIEVMKGVAYDRSKPRPTVLIVGEYLLNFHPGANREIERYLESNGFEIIEARMTDVIRKTYFYMDAQVKEYDINVPRRQAAWYAIANRLFEHAHDVCDRIAAEHPLYEPPTRMPELVEASDPIIHHTFDAGEGVLIPAEILHNAKRGCRNFLILQPFGCLPNHVVGRGISKRLKELYPDAQILPLDYDPDVSFANLENRLQMLIMNARANEPEQTDSNGTLGKGGQGEPHARLSDVIELPTANKVPDSLAACMAAVADLNRVIEKQATLFRSAITEDFIAQALYLLKHVDDVKAAADRIVQHSAHLKEQTERIGTEMLEQLKGSSQRDDTAHRADDIVSSARELAHLTDIEAKLYAKTVSRRADIIHGMGERALRHSSDKAHELRSEGIDLAEQLAEQASELQERAKRVSREAALIA